MVAAGLGAALPAYLARAALGAVLAVVDVEQHRLPNQLLTVLAAAGGVLLTVASGVDNRWDSLGRAALTAIGVGVIFYLVALASPRSVGLGDVKLAALLAGFLAAGVAALVLLGIGRANRSTDVPLGPFLIGAALLAAALHS